MTDVISVSSEIVLPRDKTWKFDFADMFHAVDKLTTLLNQENEHLDSMHIKGITDLQERKAQLVWLLELQKDYLSKNPGLISGLSEMERARVRMMGENLEKALAYNYQKLSVAKMINQKIVQAVTAALTDSYGMARGYGDDGSRGITIGRERSAMPPVAFNEAV